MPQLMADWLVTVLLVVAVAEEKLKLPQAGAIRKSKKRTSNEMQNMAAMNELKAATNKSGHSDELVSGPPPLFFDFGSLLK